MTASAASAPSRKGDDDNASQDRERSAHDVGRRRSLPLDDLEPDQRRRDLDAGVSGVRGVGHFDNALTPTYANQRIIIRGRTST